MINLAWIILFIAIIAGGGFAVYLMNTKGKEPISNKNNPQPRGSQ